MPNPMTEAQIRKAAQATARKASKLRAKGQDDLARMLVNEAALVVMEMRKRGMVVR